eukprot:m.143503 g.143503  ORF g.143503 m.143503 type:complete len:78 (-) comp14097_c0_seq2:9338-9571(-)
MSTTQMQQQKKKKQDETQASTTPNQNVGGSLNNEAFNNNKITQARKQVGTCRVKGDVLDFVHKCAKEVTSKTKTNFT